MAEKAKTFNSESQKELDKAQVQFDEFDKQVKDLTLDRMNSSPREDVEPQTKMSQKELEKSTDVYLKPNRSVSSKEKFNEKYREDFNFATEYVRFIAENKEIIGETIELWTKPFAGMPAQEWKIPVNTPVWGPRHLAEQLTKARYHRLKMEQNRLTGSDGQGNQYFGQMAVDTIIQRLDALPVSSRKSIFMGASDFKYEGKKTA